MPRTMIRAVLAAALALTLPGVAGGAHHGDKGGQAEASADAMASGEVRKIDKDAGKLTIRHGEIKNLEMPPMTMVFRVKDAAMLDQVKAGDQIRFSAEKIGGAFTVMKIERGN